MSKSRIFLWVASVFVGLWLVAPTLVVIPMSFNEQRSLAFPPKGFSLRWYENFFASSQWLGGLLNSVQIAILTAIIATVIGTLAAYGLSKVSGIREAFGRNFLILPMLIPSVIFGVGLYGLFLRIGLVGTLPGFLLAHTVLAVPYVVVTVGSTLAAYDVQLERAAWICGASKPRAFMTVTVPALLPGILSGAFFAFITSFDEVVVSTFISSPYLQTLPVRMFSGLQREVDPTIAAAATLIMITTTAAALGSILSQQLRRNRR
ncbi:ABC transporter permease [Brevibacterium gallinarum]|uniref:ABC transporter permease n=1 Tax=Brevibacterium gallinarum TaxID=2762220 RepID=A0ABR8WXQ6_9MICO|nr:ABC transporter permease [Brevibacterium gallinarum]MBD8021795.1 ABC transporter permease [Brevibacterium gallinarum]NUL60439.1 ABC transporter permease [Brevibacterium luteolum]